MIEYYRKYKRFFFPLLALFISLYLVQTASHFGEKHIPVTGEGKWNRGSRLCRWDTGFYISIIEQGYRYIPGEQCNLAFFPLYPLMAKLLMSFGFSIPIALLSISWVSIILSVYLLYGIFLDRVSASAITDRCKGKVAKQASKKAIRSMSWDIRDWWYRQQEDVEASGKVSWFFEI